ncbi:MAG: hypothetical protein RQ899_14630 [Pseudomonadales bacterium]|nr:hypothetical protein [Pseudomonadales bacterium]
MMEEKKAAPGKSSSNRSNSSNTNTRKARGKLESMMSRFLNGERIHRFQAEQMGDHVLPSSVATLQRKFGIQFRRVRVKVPNRFGGETSVMEYWLDPQQQADVRRWIADDPVTSSAPAQ